MKINSYHRNSIISLYYLSLFTKVFCTFSGIFIEKTTFEEFVEIFEQIHRNSTLHSNSVIIQRGNVLFASNES